MIQPMIDDQAPMLMQNLWLLKADHHGLLLHPQCQQDHQQTSRILTSITLPSLSAEGHNRQPPFAGNWVLYLAGLLLPTTEIRL